MSSIRQSSCQTPDRTPVREPVSPRERPGELLRWLAGQVLLVAALIATYFGVRGATAGSATVAVAHARQVVRLEDLLGIGFEHELQAPVVAWDPIEDAANWIYIWGHWPVIVATLLWLGIRHRSAYRRLRDAMVVSGLLGMAVFVSWPLAPPRLASLGLVDTVTQKSEAYRVLQPPAFVNQYAAMPSLHAGWDLIVGISIATAAGSLLLRAIGCVLPVLMALAVVTTANHYILDVVAGVSLALFGYAVAVWWERRRDSRRAPP